MTNFQVFKIAFKLLANTGEILDFDPRISAKSKMINMWHSFMFNPSKILKALQSFTFEVKFQESS